jgi:hypothetical protein
MLLSKQIAVSFEGGHVKVAYGSRRNGTLIVTRTLLVKDEEFDFFLSQEKINDFIVVFGFQTFYQDVLLLPPVEEKYLDTLLVAEIRKNAPELKEFVFFSKVIRDKVHEGRQVKEIFVFAADPSEISPLLERFSRQGKRVRHLYADVLAASYLIIDAAKVQEKTIICMVDKEGHKILFLTRNGKVIFVRNIQSRGRGIDQYDMTNVNMTVNYARQTLREHPDELIILSTSKDKISPVEGLALPASVYQYPPNIMITGEDSTEFALPIAGLLIGKRLGKESLLPRTYQGLLLQERILRYSMAIFCVISIVCLGYIISGWNQVCQIRTMIAPLKAEIAGRAVVYEQFESRSRELQIVLPYIQYLNGESAAPDIQKCLVTLQALNRDKILVKDIEIKNTGRDLAIQIKGNISANSFGELQSRFRRLIDDIKAVEGMQGVSEKLDLVSRDFSVELTWKQ